MFKGLGFRARSLETIATVGCMTLNDALDPKLYPRDPVAQILIVLGTLKPYYRRGPTT